MDKIIDVLGGGKGGVGGPAPGRDYPERAMTVAVEKWTDTPRPLRTAIVPRRELTSVAPYLQSLTAELRFAANRRLWLRLGHAKYLELLADVGVQ